MGSPEEGTAPPSGPGTSSQYTGFAYCKGLQNGIPGMVGKVEKGPEWLGGATTLGATHLVYEVGSCSQRGAKEGGSGGGGVQPPEHPESELLLSGGLGRLAKVWGQWAFGGRCFPASLPFGDKEPMEDKLLVEEKDRSAGRWPDGRQGNRGGPEERRKMGTGLQRSRPAAGVGGVSAATLGFPHRPTSWKSLSRESMLKGLLCRAPSPIEPVPPSLGGVCEQLKGHPWYT